MNGFPDLFDNYKTQQNRRLGCLAFRASSLPRLSHANTYLYVTHVTITSGDICMKDYYGIAKKFFEMETLCSLIQENLSLKHTSNF